MSKSNNTSWTPRVGTMVCPQTLSQWLSQASDQGTLVLLVGPPASGKSRLATKLAEAGMQLVGLDRIRQRHYGDEDILGNDTEVLSHFYQELQKLFSQKQPVVVDNTNVFAEHRLAIIELAQRAGYKGVYIVLLEVPLRVCLKNNRRRARKVTPEFIKQRHGELQRQRPTPEEGALIILRRAPIPGYFRITCARF